MIQPNINFNIISLPQSSKLVKYTSVFKSFNTSLDFYLFKGNLIKGKYN